MVQIPPFDKKELEVIGSYPSVVSDAYYTSSGYETPKLRTPITPRENWDLFFKHENPYWVPDGIADLNLICPAVLPDTIPFTRGGVDAFGVEWVSEGGALGGAMPTPGVTRLEDMSEWEKLEWPDVASWDWSKAKSEHKVLDPDRPTCVFYPTGVFERMISLVGFEQAAISFYEYPDEVHNFLDKLLEYNLECMRYLKRYLNIDIFELSDDWGSSKSQFLSEALYREFLVPHVKELASAAHEMGIHFMHHCCGNVNALVPLMIEEGVDYWQMNWEAVKPGFPDTLAKYKDQILFDAPIGAVEPVPEKDDDFRVYTAEQYRTYANTGCVSMNFWDYNYRSFNTREYLYQQARLTMLGE
jgi:hypothetical protein